MSQSMLTRPAPRRRELLRPTRQLTRHRLGLLARGAQTEAEITQVFVLGGHAPTVVGLTPSASTSPRGPKTRYPRC